MLEPPATGASYGGVAISTSSTGAALGGLAAGPGGYGYARIDNSNAFSAAFGFSIPPTRFQLTSSVVYYMIGQMITGSAATAAGFGLGRISARRVR